MIFKKGVNFTITSANTERSTITLAGVDVAQRLVPFLLEVDYTFAINALAIPVSNYVTLNMGIGKDDDFTLLPSDDDLLHMIQFQFAGDGGDPSSWTWSQESSKHVMFNYPFAVAKETLDINVGCSALLTAVIGVRLTYEIKKIKDSELVALIA